MNAPARPREPARYLACETCGQVVLADYWRYMGCPAPDGHGGWAYPVSFWPRVE